MLLVKQFLCFKLETGGKIIGWFTIVLSAFLILLSLLIAAGTFLTSCDSQFQKDFDDVISMKFGLNFELSDCQSITLEILLISSIMLLLAIGSFVVYFQLLRGISSRSHERVLPALILEIISLGILIIDELIAFDMKALVEGIITACISFYICIVLYSLYIKFKLEKKEANVKVMYSKPEGIPEDLLLI